jgi:hypothetical protein
VRRLIAAAAAMLIAASCGGGEDEPPAATGGDAAFGVNVASYEPVAGHAQRFIAGLTADEGELVSFGTVEFAFSYLGTKDAPAEPPVAGPRVEATFLPVPGQPEVPAGAEPKIVPPSEGVGVYSAPQVTFPDAGFWEVEVTAVIDGEKQSATGAFEVFAEPRLPFPGEQAPRTRNHVWGTPDVPAKAIDSRAEEGGDDPAPGLHDDVIADVIAAGRPMVIVVATPVYCQSRFCGPITEMVAEVADDYGDRAEFVHLEVFRDFDSNSVNAAAAEWALVPGGGLQEPWTYLVGGDGVIVERWDNIATKGEITKALDSLLL